jgi:hypothetical protein
MAKVYPLQFCCTCRKPIREADSYIRWEKEIYCEACFDEYLAIVEPSNLLKKKKDEEEQ